MGSPEASHAGAPLVGMLELEPEQMQAVGSPGANPTLPCWTGGWLNAIEWSIVRLHPEVCRLLQFSFI